MITAKQFSRRGFIQNSMFGLRMIPLASLAGTSASEVKPLKIVCIGAHLDDP